jgi:hypothetical protein
MIEEKKENLIPRSPGLRRLHEDLAQRIIELEEVEGRWLWWEGEFREVRGIWDQEKRPGYLKVTSSTHSGLACVSLQDQDVEMLSEKAGELLKKGIENLEMAELEELEGELEDE